MAMEETDIVIMGEKEFFDVMKYANRHLTMEERYLIAGIVKEIIKPREGVKKKDTQKLLELFPGYTMESMVQYMLNTPPKNYWDLLNAATWVTTHVMKRDAEVTHKFESRIFDTVKNMAARA